MSMLTYSVEETGWPFGLGGGDSVPEHNRGNSREPITGCFQQNRKKTLK